VPVCLLQIIQGSCSIVWLADGTKWSLGWLDSIFESICWFTIGRDQIYIRRLDTGSHLSFCTLRRLFLVYNCPVCLLFVHVKRLLTFFDLLLFSWW
jgi:hypothetical protein